MVAAGAKNENWPNMQLLGGILMNDPIRITLITVGRVHCLRLLDALKPHSTCIFNHLVLQKQGR